MPFKPIDFANIEPQGNPFLRDFVSNLAKGYQAGQLPQQLERQRQKEELANQMQKLLVQEQPQKFGEESQGRQLGNAFQALLNQEQPTKFGSEMSSAGIARALQQANMNRINTMTPLEARELALKNELYPELTKSTIANNMALAKQRNLGYGGLSTGARDQLFLRDQTQESNPNFTPQQVVEASNVIRQGKTTLSDGTPINVNQDMQDAADRIAKGVTTSALFTQAKTGQQAEKEIGVLSDYIVRGIGEYGDTFYGHSPKAIVDSFSNKKEDQEKLGRLMAAMQLQVEQAAVQERLATNKSTATITEEIMKHAQNDIKASWPFVSQVARTEQNRYLREALTKGLKERQKIRLGLSNVNATTSPENGEKKNRLKFNPSTGDFE